MLQREDQEQTRPERSRRPARRGQRVFLGLGVTFLLFLVSVAVYRSAGRDSGFGGSPQEQRTDASSKLHLQEFYRIQMKNGRQEWEIRAKDAKYFAEQKVTFVTDAELTVLRENESPVKVSSSSAKLFMEGDDLRRAELEGDVRVLPDPISTVTTTFAVYDAVRGTVTSPVEVMITGEGFDTSGRGMELEIEPNIIRLLSEVRSKFASGAAVPKLGRRK